MRTIFLSVALVALTTSPALASWAAVPLEILVDEADLIVAGKVARVQDGGFALGPRKYDVAVVDVSGIVKSLSGKPKEVHIGQPNMGGLAVSTDIRFQPGQQGVWLLSKDPDRNVYWARHPSQFQDAKKQKELADLVAAREKLPGGKVVNGLVARAELVEHKPARGPTSQEVRLSLKNTSDKPITLCDYVGNRPLQVTWIGPDEKMLKSNHYAWLARAFLPGLMKTNFMTIPPGGVRFVGPRGAHSGIWFQAQPTAEVNQAPVGQNKITVSLVTKEDGKPFGLERVWVGTVTANEVTLEVK